MFRNGRFQNIEWTNLPQKHRKYWQILEEKYGLQPIKSEFSASLDIIAQRCIRQCAAQLWEKWCKQRPAYNIDYLIPPNLLENYLSAALCDHLIVTFAYRFYCENLESAPRDRYWRDIQNAAETYSDASNFHKKFKVFDEDLENIIKNYKELLNTDLKCAKGALDAQQRNLRQMRQNMSLDKSTESSDTVEGQRESYIREKLVASEYKGYTSTKRNLSKQEQLIQRILDSMNSDHFRNEDLSAPSWIFSFAMATNWRKSPFRVTDGEFAFAGDQQDKSKSNRLERLTDFIGNSEWSRLLLKPEKESIPLLSFTPIESRRKQLLSRTASIMEFRIPTTDPRSSSYSEDWKETVDIVLRSSIYPTPRELPPVISLRLNITTRSHYHLKFNMYSIAIC